MGANPNLLYPIKLAGQLCRPAELAACVGNETSAATLATVCCTELLDPFSEGPEETISLVELFGYVLIVPGERLTLHTREREGREASGRSCCLTASRVFS